VPVSLRAQPLRQPSLRLTPWQAGQPQRFSVQAPLSAAPPWPSVPYTQPPTTESWLALRPSSIAPVLWRLLWLSAPTSRSPAMPFILQAQVSQLVSLTLLAI